ncbi:cell wall hydrolase [Methylorubrum populi]|uniref:Cell wall hydrolase n=1 Tax=Methylorubrum populi TaxID=223967 RepID=A0A921JGW3_9HYPH|nr:cell wall hydrolase [Methylorubrum populi]
MRARRVRGLGLGPRWIVSAVVPWIMASGLLVSFTATAGTDATLRPELLSQRDVATTGALVSSTGWNPDVIEAGFVAVPGSAHEVEAGEDGLPSLADSDGATPATPRAVALSSVTPAPADATPVEVAAANLVLPGFSARLDRGPSVLDPQMSTPEAKSHYADLINPEAMDREQRCLAEAVYFEARSEPEEGQAAVAQVVLNRVKSGLYPSSVCGVVYQNRHRFMGCQFSFACEGKSLRITDAESWRSATRVASAVIEGRTYVSEVGGATHYHADYVRPGWSRRLKRKDMIGRHIFYQLKPNQT